MAELSEWQREKQERFERDLAWTFGEEGAERFTTDLRRLLKELWERGQGVPFEDQKEQESVPYVPLAVREAEREEIDNLLSEMLGED